MAAALIVGGIAAGASIYASHKAGQAAKQATTQQVESADKALALQKELYEQTRTDLAPYREQGGQGLTMLTNFLRGPVTASGPPGVSSSFTGTPIRGGRPNAPFGAAPAAPAAPLNAPPTAPAPGATGGPPPDMVAMRSPNGTLGYVPQARVPDALAAGGQVVR